MPSLPLHATPAMCLSARALPPVARPSIPARSDRMATRRRSVVAAIILACTFGCLVTATRTVAGELTIEVPSPILSGVKVGLTAKLATVDAAVPTGTASPPVPSVEPDGEVPYQITVAGIVVATGTASSSSELVLEKVVLPSVGRQTLEVVLGPHRGTTRIRTIPGWVAILPPLVAIVLAMITREVLFSLFVGVWVGALVMFDYHPLVGLLRTVDTYLINSLTDKAHAAIIIFSMTLGGMVGVLNRTGGMQGIVELIARYVRGPRSAQFAAWLMGVAIFFDDYANTLIVGNSMRPITDRNRVSREKLAYVVDTTSAPVAGIALLSTWVGYEIGLMRESFIKCGLIETNYYAVFLQTLPFRFYCVLSLFFGLVICLTRKEFGPMHTAESRCRSTGAVLADGAQPISSPEAAMPELPAEMPKRWYNAFLPILLVIAGTMVGLLYSGGYFDTHAGLTTWRPAAGETVAGDARGATGTVVKVLTVEQVLVVADEDERLTKLYIGEGVTAGDSTGEDALKQTLALAAGEKIRYVAGAWNGGGMLRVRVAFGGAESGTVLIWASFLGSILAILLGWSQRLVTLKEAMDGWLAGARSMVLAMLVLVLAWSINAVCSDLKSASYIIDLVGDQLKPWMLPALVFIISCLASFATGTSWGTMAIVLPISIPLGAALYRGYYQQNMAEFAGILSETDYVRGMLLVSLGAVLEGSIFGDHCSPISDTTIMSSMASGSDHIDHVRTQLPYAVTVAIVSILVCYLPAGLGVSPWLVIPLAMVTLLLILHWFGTVVTEPGEADEAEAGGESEETG